MRAYKLGDIVNIKKGRKVDNTSDVYLDGSKRFIQIDDLRNDNKIKYTKSDGIYATENDVLIAWDGANAGTVGYGLSGVIGSTIASLEINNNQFIGAFIGKYLQSKFHRIRQNCTGATIPHVRRDYLLGITVPNIDKQEQKQIVQTLDTADTLRQKRKDQLNLLDDYLKSVFFEMFGDPVTNEMEWEVVRLEDIFAKSAQNGLYVEKEKYSQNGTEMVHMADAFYDIVELGKLKRADISLKEIEKYKLTSDDLLIARRSLNYEGAAKPCMIPKTTGNLVYESSLIRITPDQNKALPIYLYFYLSDKRIRGKYILKMITKSTISGINQTNLKNIQVVCPFVELQNKFASIVEQVEQTKQKMRTSLDEMDNHFNALMQRYFG